MTTVSFESFKKSLLQDLAKSQSFEDVKIAFDGNLALVRGYAEPCQWSPQQINELLAQANEEIQHGEGITHERMEELMMSL